MEREEIKQIIETLLFVSKTPLSVDKIVEVVKDGADKKTLKEILAELVEEYRGRALQIKEIAEGYQLCTRPENSAWVKEFLKIERRTRLSRPSLETLAIVAYKQPITRVEIEQIRRVDVSGILRGLLEKRLVKMVGRKKVMGRPIMYGTTKEFLEYFGLGSLTDLPRREEFVALYDKGSSKEEESKEEESKEAELFDNPSQSQDE